MPEENADQTNTCDSKPHNKDDRSAWTDRVEIARRQNQEAVMKAALLMVDYYDSKLSPTDEDPDVVTKANLLRKRIESSEQHRTMCVEHGLSDAAIDATYEIQDIEKQLVALLQEFAG
jgi:hypothetical protein